MGFSNAWVAVKGVPKAALLDRLEAEETEIAVEPHSEVLCVGRSSKGWILFCSSGIDFAKRAEELSQGGVAVACWLEEHVMDSAARGFSDGKEAWSVCYEENGLTVAGEPPEVFAKIRAKAEAKQAKEEKQARETKQEHFRVDYIFEAPVELSRAVCGFRIDEGDGSGFTLLKYKPRPRGEGPEEEARGFWGAVKLGIKRRLNWW